MLKKGTNKLTSLELKTDDSESTTTSVTNDEDTELDIREESKNSRGFKYLSGDAKVVGSIPDTALMSLHKAFHLHFSY